MTDTPQDPPQDDAPPGPLILPDEADQPVRDPAARLDRKVLEALVCPVTRGLLTYDAKAQELLSQGAGLAYPIRNGIPVMLIDEARKLED